MKRKKEKSPDYSEQLNSKTTFILKKFDENVKYQYEIIDFIEKAKEVTKQQLMCMIQEAKEEIGKAVIVAKLENILEKRFYE